MSRKRTSCAAHRARSASLFVDSCRAGSGRPRSCSSGAASERESPITSLAMRSQSAKKPAVRGRGDEPDRVHRLAAAVGTRSQGSSAATPPASSPGSADTQPAVTPLTRGSRSAEDEPSADRGAPRRATVRDFLPKFTKCADTEESAGYGLSAVSSFVRKRCVRRHHRNVKSSIRCELHGVVGHPACPDTGQLPAVDHGSAIQRSQRHSRRLQCRPKGRLPRIGGIAANPVLRCTVRCTSA